jgi:hypothetical protein
VTIRREQAGKTIGILDAKDFARLDVAIAFVMGLADWNRRIWFCCI